MMRFLAVLFAALALAPAAQAQKPHDPVKTLAPDQPYRHGPSGLTIPPTLDGLARKDVRVFEADLDESVVFERRDPFEVVTIYVFRHVTGDVPVWFAQASGMILAHTDDYGPLAPAAPPTSFTPPGQTSASGLMATWSGLKSPLRSTGLALLPMGDNWFIKLRVSSTLTAAEALPARMMAVIAALGWPKRIADQPVAAPVVVCSSRLAISASAAPLKGKAAEAAATVGGLLDKTLAEIADKKRKRGPAAPPPRWCRDPDYGTLGSHGVYRPDGATDRFIIALNDAGRAIAVAPDQLTALVAGTKEPVWAIKLIDVGNVDAYLGRDGLLAPPDALAVINRETARSRTSSWGPSRIIVSSDPPK